MLPARRLKTMEKEVQVNEISNRCRASSEMRENWMDLGHLRRFYLASIET